MNPDQLTIALAFFFALLLLIAIGGLIYLGRYLLRERRKKTWRFFAAANNLAIKSGTFPQGAAVSGVVNGYRLSLRSRGKQTQMTLTRQTTVESTLLQDHEATVAALVKLLATIYHNAFTRPTLQRLYTETQRSRPAIFEFIGFFWRMIQIMRGKSFREAFFDDGPNVDLDHLQKLESIFKALTQKIAKVYGVDPLPLYKEALKNSPFLPDFPGALSVSGKGGVGHYLDNFQQSMENTLAASHIKGQVTLENAGHLVSYRQDSLETDSDYLQSVLHLLTDIAEAYPAVIDLGMDSVPFLRETATSENALSLVVRHLIDDIAAETRRRLGQAPDRFLCLRCMTRCAEHRLTLPDGHSIAYYGCRTCRQSRTFFEGRVVMLLNQHYSAAEPIQQDGKLRVNWFIERTLFDFDEVEIVAADDEAVEYFAVKVGNDTDPVRQPRYKEMPCSIAPECELSANSLRILERTFGEVIYPRDAGDSV